MGIQYEISDTPTGVQVSMLSYNYGQLKPKEQVKEGDFDWPRLKAAAEQLRQDIPSLEDCVLESVEQRTFHGGWQLSKQFSFRRIK